MLMQEKKIVKQFISDICGLLKIQVPKVEYVEDLLNLPTSTTLAQCSSTGKEIRLREGKLTFDTMFAVCHELRHIWQLQNKPEYFTSYITDSGKDTEAYNLQIAEIDANAFAKVIMVETFGVTPLFTGLSDVVKAKIDSWIETTIREEFRS